MTKLLGESGVKKKSGFVTYRELHPSSRIIAWMLSKYFYIRKPNEAFFFILFHNVIDSIENGEGNAPIQYIAL